MLETLVTDITQLASQHSAIAYAIVGLSAMAEALPVAGTLVPGSMLIVGISALVSSGALGTVPLILAALAGAIAGDGISFWLGYRYESRITGIWPLSRYPQWVARAEVFFQRHGGKGVFLARFVQGPRAFVPLAAGMSGMPPGRFYVVNIASGIIWATTHVLTGVLLGESLHVVAQIAGRLVVLLVLVALLVWIVIWLTRRVLLTHGLQALQTGMTRLEHWCAPQASAPQRGVARLLATVRGEGLMLVTAIAVLLGCLWLFLGILEDLLTGDQLVQANQAIFHAFQALRTHWGDTLMLAITEFGDSFVTTSLSVTVAAWLLARRAWSSALYWLAAVGGAALFTPLIKALVHWPRPTAGLYSGWEAFSFPSGHATINTVLYGFLAYLVARALPARRRVWVVSAAALTVILISVSRLYLGAHWLADVSAGIAIGTVWVILLAISHQRRHAPLRETRGLSLVVLLTVAVVWPYNINQQLATDRERYAPQPTLQQLAWQDWSQTAYQQLPARRIDLGGEGEERMVLQWAGPLASLRQRLSDAGWQVDVPWTPVSTLHWLSPGHAVAGLPTLPRLNNGQPSALRATRPITGQPGRRLVLHVWPTEFTLSDTCQASPQPLWSGSLRVQQRRDLLGLLALERDVSGVTDTPALLKQALQAPDAAIRLLTPSADAPLLLATPASLVPPCSSN
ncbi:bifunctional DedA family/phosphatase PAP2 family protein [Modicisalibacter zincidurans]|mgnify:CR=1 FL=1|uniref:Bifunctional DedA family/phosphatase PAP2 family protein n=1 Tax=Modicisalibacter zincidurans TaxID=1178777 RepID=A0ABP9RF29_9GAMM|nr:bifunctional DedA family/phosphatase PAP2 family protein [Halomonas zincidurans]